MNGPDPQDLEERVLVLAPTAKDAEASRVILTGAGITCVVCKDLEEVCSEIGRGGGAALLTQESILSDRSGCLSKTLDKQPRWSDFPLVVLTPARPDSSQSARRLEAIGHMTLMKRPVPIAELVSTIRAALRDRRRQYETRDYLAERERQGEALRASEQRLRFALDVGKLGSWQLDLPDRTLTCSDTCKVNYGRFPGSSFTYDDLIESIHPNDREGVRQAVNAAIEGRADYETEYRTVWPDGTIHWVLVRGRGEYDLDGQPLRMTGLSLDITERRRLEEALRNQAERLKEADQRKDEFLAMLAHELRNPLAAISNAVQVTTLTGLQDHVDWCMDVIARQIKHLGRLIDDLLDVSRITRGKIQLRKENIDPYPVLNAAVETVRPLAQERKHQLTVSFGPGLRVEADPTRLEQILVNLLTNAAKYTESGGHIQLTAGQVGDEVVIKVRDNGIGIPPEKLPQMFELFAQGDRTLARSEGGLGIGLTLVRSLTEMHGGRVTATSEGSGRGSEFVVHLPAAPSPARESPRFESRSPTAPSRSTRILVVDDNVDTSRGLARLLKLLGHEVLMAHDGRDAIEAARLFQPEVVLLDIGLPGMDGYQVATRLRADVNLKDILIIAVSGYGQEDDRRRSQEAGFDHHLVKPIDHDTLMTLLSR